METETVYVLTIDHRHGVNTYVNRTAEGSNAALHAYVCEWWDNEAERGSLPADMPDDADEAIAAYFDAVPDEFYTMEDHVTIGD